MSGNNQFGKFVVYNAYYLNDTQFACLIFENHTFKSLSYEYDKMKMSLTFDINESFVNIKSIHFGNDSEINMCNPLSYQYKLNETSVNL